jgi:hypothetical protein
MVASGIWMLHLVRMHSMYLDNTYFKAEATLQDETNPLQGDTVTSAASTSNSELKTTGEEKVPASTSLLLLPPPTLPILPLQKTSPSTHIPTPTPLYPSLTGGTGAALGTRDSSAGELPATPQKFLAPERLSISARPSSTGGAPQQLSEAPKEAEVSVHGSPRLSMQQRLSQFARSLRLSMRRSAHNSRSLSLIFGQRRESARNAEVPPPEDQDGAKPAPEEIEMRTASSSECLTVQDDSGTVNADTDAISGALPDPDSETPKEAEVSVHGSPRLSMQKHLSRFARSLRLSMRRSAHNSRSLSLIFGQRRESAKNAEVPPPDDQDGAKAAPVHIEVRTASSSECLIVQEDSGTVTADTDAISGALPDPESGKSGRSNLTVTFDDGSGRVFRNKARCGSSAKAGQVAKQWTLKTPFASMGGRAGCLSPPDVC